MRRSGYSFSTRDHSRSAAADWMFIGCNVIITSGGESTAGMESFPDEPRWIDSTVPVSQHAFQSGSQYSLWKLGYPRVAGFSVKLREWHPFSATRRTSCAVSSASQIAGTAMGMKRPGWAAHQV